MRSAAVAAVLVLVAARAAAQEESPGTTPGTSAMPAAHRVLVARESAPGIAAAATTGYGYTEDVLGRSDAHHRLTGGLAFAGRPVRWLTIAGRVDGRWDHHLVGGTDDQSAVGELRLAVRGDVVIARGLALGAVASVFVPGTDFPSLDFSATTLDVRALAATTLPGTSLTLALDAGWRFDGTRHAVARPIQFGAADLVSLGASDSDALLLGLGAVLGVGAWELFAEATADVLVSAGTAASPVRAALGARVPLVADLLWLHAAAELGLGGRLPVDASQPLTPIEPRFALVVGLVLAPRAPHATTTGDARADHARRATPAHPGGATADGVVRGRVLDPSGTPIAHATIRPVGAEAPATTTDANGDFALPGVRPGSVLEVVAEGYVGAHFTAGRAPAAGVVLARALPAGALRGVVRSMERRSIEARVRIEPGGATATTDADGVFEVPLAPGHYTVVIEAEGQAAQTRHVEVERGGVTVMNVDLRRER